MGSPIAKSMTPNQNSTPARPLIASKEAELGQTKQHDAVILASLLGVERAILATLLAEA